MPAILSAVTQAGPANVLSATVSARTLRTDSVSVLVRVGALPSSDWTMTPAVRVVGDSATVPVLGLLAETLYTLQPVAWLGDRSVAGATSELVTGPLPSDLPYSIAFNRTKWARSARCARAP